MKKILYFFCVLLGAKMAVFAQYTDVINSNNPGKSLGSYAVGRKVIQLETEFFYEQSKHEMLYRQQDNFGVNYEVRYGVWREQLELILDGTFLYDKMKTLKSPILSESKMGFHRNALGAKYLVYNPYFEDKPNIYSWNANAKFNWRKMIPAVSVYLGANFYSKNRFLYETYNEEFGMVTPKAVVSLQSHPTRDAVFVVNFVGDNLLSTHRQLGYIVTFTHNLYNARWSIFLENEGIKSTYYNDSLIRFGASFLVSSEFQLNAWGGASWKTTPTRYTAAIGLSYRIYNRHRDVEYKEKIEARDKETKKNAEIFQLD